MNNTRLIVWILVALLAGIGSGYYFGHSTGYDEAVNYFIAQK